MAFLGLSGIPQVPLHPPLGTSNPCPGAAVLVPPFGPFPDQPPGFLTKMLPKSQVCPQGWNFTCSSHRFQETGSGLGTCSPFQTVGVQELTCAPSGRGICVQRFRSPHLKNTRGCHLCRNHDEQLSIFSCESHRFYLDTGMWLWSQSSCVRCIHGTDEDGKCPGPAPGPGGFWL